MPLVAFERLLPAFSRELRFAFGEGRNDVVPHIVPSKNLRRPHVGLLGFNDRKCGDLNDNFKRDKPPASLRSETEKLSFIPRYFNMFDTIIVDFDAFEDIEIGVDALLSFREENPQVGIVLVSSRVARDEFGGQRKMLCDCTLRYPVTSNRLIEALNAARLREDSA